MQSKIWLTKRLSFHWTFYQKVPLYLADRGFQLYHKLNPHVYLKLFLHFLFHPIGLATHMPKLYIVFMTSFRGCLNIWYSITLLPHCSSFQSSWLLAVIFPLEFENQTVQFQGEGILLVLVKGLHWIHKLIWGELTFLILNLSNLEHDISFHSFKFTFVTFRSVLFSSSFLHIS